MIIVELSGPSLASAIPWIEQQLRRRQLPLTLGQIVEKIEQSHMTALAIIADEPIALMLLTKDENGAHIFYAAGHRLDEWEALAIQTAEEWAELNNCDRLIVEGRKGWAKRLAKYGFKRGESWLSKAVAKHKR